MTEEDIRAVLGFSMKFHPNPSLAKPIRKGSPYPSVSGKVKIKPYPINWRLVLWLHDAANSEINAQLGSKIKLPIHTPCEDRDSIKTNVLPNKGKEIKSN